MSWQDELRKLDEELAAGQISADDYRVRRDQVLSSAVASGPDNPAGRPGTDESTQLISQKPAPPPPAAAAEPSADNDDDADRTQIVPGDADRTQTVGGWTARPPGPGAIPGVPPQSYAGNAPPRPAPQQGSFPPHPGYQQGWQGEELSPPWAGSEFPPLAPTSNPDWIRQGPEVFEGGGRSNTGRTLLITLAVIVVLAVAGGIVYLTVFRDTEQGANPQTGQTSAPATRPTTTSKPPPTYGPLRVPQGRSDGGKTYTMAELEAAGALASPDLILLKQAGMTEARSVIVGDGTTTLSLWSFAVGDANALAKDFTDDQQRFGFKEAPGGMNGIQAFASTQQNAGRTVYALRAHYVSNGRVIRVEAFDPNETKAQDHFMTILKDQLDQTPPE